ncbi:MAG TPA: DNA internalization-related competence protein ComEC/Rec2 [Acholeplasma sp.]|jgi:competence protein ComEC|nr:DNA internalization-related competence protein ComEC/Rec2 [Acholeplasma sp.]
MLFLKELKNKSLYKKLLNNYFLVALGIVLFLLSLKHYIVIFVTLVYLVYIYKKAKAIFYTIITIAFLIIFIYLLKLLLQTQEHHYLEGQIINIKKSDASQTLTVKKSWYKIMVYTDLETEYSVLDYVKFKGEEVVIDDVRIPYDFDYKEYLKHQGISKVINASSVIKTKKRFSYLYLRELIANYIDKYFKEPGNMIIKGLVIGDSKSFTLDFASDLRINGTSHLFAISGAHVNIITYFLIKVFSKAKHQDKIVSSLLIIYLFLTNFLPSVLRAVLMYLMHTVNKKYKLHLKTLDLLSLAFIFMLIINPCYFFNLSFQLSFIVTAIIVLITTLVKDKSSLIQTIIISAAAVIVTLPIIANINSEVNLLSPFVNVVFIFLVLEILLPLSFVILFLPFLNKFYNLLVQGFLFLNNLFASQIKICIPLPYFKIYHALIYYGFFVFFFSLRKLKLRKIVLASFLFLFSCFILFQSSTTSLKVTFLDLYNGESILIQKGTKQILIDTGTGQGKKVSSFLKKTGVYSLDYLIITHDHFDHYGEAKDICEAIRVKKIITSSLSSLSFPRQIKISSPYLIKLGRDQLILYPPQHQDLDENNNSIISFLRSELNFLFLGDLVTTGEARLNGFKDSVDVLKVGHHGSKTATSPNLLRFLKPKYAIIQTGRVKSFAFPDHETITRLNSFGIKTYRTDLHYTIIYKNKKFTYLNQ